MDHLNHLKKSLDAYSIPIDRIEGNRVFCGNYEIEVEANGLYKLYDEGYVIAPFSDVETLCQFILNDSKPS
jgi:hypothetical protein